MAESLEKQLINAFSQAWSEAATEALLGQPSTLNSLAIREVTGDGMASALAVAMTWSAAFAAPCTEALSGVLICLFKSEDSIEIDRLAAPRASSDGAPQPGARALVASVLEPTARNLTELTSLPINFGAVKYIDLTADETRLARVVGDAAWVATCSLSLGNALDTQALLLYAPHGTLDEAVAQDQNSQAINMDASPRPGNGSVNSSTPSATTPSSHSQQQSNASRRAGMRREEPPPRNIERLLEVELEIVVRFGVTEVPLREVVRLGSGTMIELNRSVDEPVELLINNRLLARGEVVVVDGYYGVRITEIGTPEERSLSLTAGVTK